MSQPCLPKLAFRPRDRFRLITVALLLCLGLAVVAAAVTPSQRMIAPGVRYALEQRPQGPFNINLVELDPRERYILLACTVGGGSPVRTPVSAIAQTQSSATRYAVAAVNGDYFIMGGAGDGTLLGVNVSAGQLISARTGRSALVVMEDGRAQVATLRLDAELETPGGTHVAIKAINQPRRQDDIVLYTSSFGASTRTAASGREVVLAGVPEPLALGEVYQAQVTASTHAVGNLALWSGQVAVSASGRSAAALERLAVGDTVKLSFDLAPHPQGRIVEAVGGGPRLVRDGRVSVEWRQENFKSNLARQRHPRTAAGVKPDGHVVLVTVDGRQFGSVGMTLEELAQLMVELGCRDALNLDGGGSTTMWVRGRVVNRPSGGSQRPVANALLVMSTAPHGPPTRVRVTPEAITALPGYRATVTVAAEDDYYNPVDLGTVAVNWAAEGAIGTVSPRGEFAAGEATETITGAVAVTLGPTTARLPVTVYARPPQLRLSPLAVTAAPGQWVQFAATPVDEQGRPISYDPAQVAWRAEPAAGVIDNRGLLAVGSGPMGTVTANLRGVEAAARVVFATTTVVVEDFEKEGATTAFSWPREVPVSWQRVTDLVAEGRCAARLDYDFTTTTQARAAYLEVNRTIGSATALRAWVYGDGRGHWLRARITDALGGTYNLDFAPRVDWSGWREVSALVPADARPPLRWDAIYVSEFHPECQDAGALVFDSLRAEVPGSPLQ